MHKGPPNDEPMCETSEKCEKLISQVEMLPIALDIGRRIMEVFGYQEISNITFRLKSNSKEINAIVNGDKLPSTELLLGIQKQTGASIDWLLTGQGTKYLRAADIAAPETEATANTGVENRKSAAPELRAPS